MWKKIQERALPLLIAISALSVSASAAFYSVSGLSKLFAGASLEVIIMASSLEFGKLVAASFLYRYWDRINLLQKFYMTLATIVLMIITSAGIYGFLTSAYQKTADQLGVLDKQVEVVELKKNRFEESLDGYKLERSQLNGSITELTKGLSNNTIQYKDRETGEIITTTSSSTRKVLTEQLNDMKTQRNSVSIKMEALTDSITSLDLKVLDLQTNNEVAAEVGPLRYMAEITGKPMAVIVNWFTLLIVFVFDPLAISMVIALNKLINKEGDGNSNSTNTQLFSNIDVVEIPTDDETDGSSIPVSKTKVGEKRKETPQKEIEEIKKEKVESVPVNDETKNIYGESKNKRYNDSVLSNQSLK